MESGISFWDLGDDLAHHGKRDDLRSSILQHIFEVSEEDPSLWSLAARSAAEYCLFCFARFWIVFNFGRPRITYNANTYNPVSLLLESSYMSVFARAGAVVYVTRSPGPFSLCGEGC